MSTAPVLPRVYSPDLAIRRWTLREYDRLGESGILTPEDRVELLDGFIADKEVNYPPHAGTVGQLAEFFSQRAAGRWTTRCQLPVRLPRQRSEPEPDLALLQPPVAAYRQRHPEPADIFLLVEVANTSVRTDRNLKLALYARARVSEYWIVVVPECVIEVHRDPARGRYRAFQTFRPGDVCAPAAFPDATLNVNELFS